MAGSLTRRALLVGAGGTVTAAAGGFALVDTGVLPGELRLHRALGACDVGAPLPKVDPGPIAYGSFRSKARGQTVQYSIVSPPGDRRPSGLPVCLYLHGLGGDHRDVSSDRIGIPWVLADRVRAGAPPFVLVGADG